MDVKEYRANFLLLLTAAIWGFAFVAQRVGAQYVGSFTFNGVRFALGSLSLIPLIIFLKKRNSADSGTQPKGNPVIPGLLSGIVLFTGASLQQIGLIDTTAGKAAFITGLYIVLVPLAGLFLKHRLSVFTWTGVLVTTVGLYLLSVTEQFTIAHGDVLELIGAFFWALHILMIDYFTKKVDSLKLSAIQCLTCAVLSLVVAVFFEKITLDGLRLALIPILYGGLGSVGIAYTLQVLAQKHAKPSHAAIILSLEAVFASVGGLIILHENLGLRGYLGCTMMLTGMFLTQLPDLKRKKLNEAENPAA